MAEAPPPLDAARPPEWTPHAPKAALEELAPPSVPVRLEDRHAYPNIPPNLLAHILTARQAPSTKMKRLLRDVTAAIAELRGNLRETLVLRKIEGLSEAETAETLGISEKAVETRLYRARQRLTASLS